MICLRKFILCVVIFTCYSSIYAQSFERLTRFEINDYFPCAVLYNKAISRVINMPVDHELVFILRTIETRLLSDSEERYIIEYDGGGSVDPKFSIYRLVNGEEQRIARIPGLELVVPGDGSVYVSGHTNNMYNKRRKFTLVDGKLEEVKQTCYYVGLDTETTQSIELCSDIDYMEKTVLLPKGSKVEVLINKEDDYLVRNTFGLTGWIHIPHGTDISKTPIKGIYWRGD